MKQRILLLSLGALAALGVAALAQSSPVSDDRAADPEANGKRETSSGRATEMFVVRNNTLVNTGWHLDSGT